MDNILTYYTDSGTLHFRCPLCGSNWRLTLPRPAAGQLPGDGVAHTPLGIEGRHCKHLTVTADKHCVKLDGPNIRVQEI